MWFRRSPAIDSVGWLWFRRGGTIDSEMTWLVFAPINRRYHG
jgi:hypothetical protein